LKLRNRKLIQEGKEAGVKEEKRKSSGDMLYFLILPSISSPFLLPER
jgi:hypothetical protein